ncbi:MULTISPECIES: PPC domain-containing DNA-binding protein [Clostridium]|uniref:DNA-binding protein n=1 Tax=Clostridium cibarium TaxID=2762247 RepID=A0ABR8PRK1_9CLOT|nr:MULTISPECIES: PPC domain-containing DNA-binding protein [Clostridium]MBD7910787.1 DNA-binding protein [Clostridium cibarium]
MIYKIFGDKIVVRLEKGEEVVASIKELCKKENIKAGSISALGATNHVVIGIYKVDEQKYYSNTFDEDLEITSLTGNISVMDDEPYLHIHATLGNIKGQCIGGHLNEARISATCEIIIQKIDGQVERKFDESIGLNVIEF